MVRRRGSLNPSFNPSFSLSYVLQITAITLNHVDEVFTVTGQVRFDGAPFTSRKECIVSKSIRNVGTSSKMCPQRKEREGKGWELVELEGSLAVTSKWLEELLKAMTGKC